ncbi:MAG: pentapeptide repeat-containing protein [Oligoflexales bacterium]
MLDSNRIHFVDKWIKDDVTDKAFRNHLFLRVTSKGRTFRDVGFTYSIFDRCYFRDCNFVNCDFTGAQFTSVNFHGAKFDNCKFEYTSFEKTNITSDILNNSSPGWENVALVFARSLRVNFHGIGDVEGVNRAIQCELDATRIHLLKTWRSRDRYYRKNYQGMRRISYFLKWLRFELGDFLWGNGESILKLGRTIVFFIIFASILHTMFLGRPNALSSYWDAFLILIPAFFGITHSTDYPDLILAFLYFARLVLIGLLMTIVVKRLSRR